MRTALVAGGAALAAAAAPVATQIFSQSEAAAVYTSAAVSNHGAPGATLAFADWLNPPIFVGAFNATTGNPVFQYTASSSSTVFQVDTARHAEAAGKGAVDTVALQVAFTGDAGGCTVLGFASTGPTVGNTPAWTYTVPNCYSDAMTGDDYRMVDMSDDGSLVVAALYVNDTATGQNLARAYALDGQTGALKWTFDAPGPASVGGAQVSADGSWVAYTNRPSTYILAGATGKQRGGATAGIPSEFSGVVSDSGAYVATIGAASAFIWAWSDASQAYAVSQTIAPPAGCAGAAGCTYPWDVVVATDDSAVEYAAFGWIPPSVLQTQVTAYALGTGAVVANWTSALNAKLQTNPTLRADKQYIGVALWGDAGGDVPTVVLVAASPAFTPGTASPVLFNASTPGSMFGVDVVVTSSTASADTVLVAAAGKHVPANEFGNGGDAFAWSVVVPTA